MARWSTPGCGNFSRFPRKKLNRAARGLYSGNRAATLRERFAKEEEHLTSDLITGLYVFVLAAFVGFEVIRRVSPLLHTPLMSLTNALDAIAVVGAIVLAGEHKSNFAAILGTLAIVTSMSNVVGGFLITDRMLGMFKASKSKKP